MSQPTFEEMLAAVRRGDQPAAADLVRRHEGYIRRVVRLRLAGQEQLCRVFDSLDICQSILAQFFVRARAGQFDLHSPEDLRRLLVSMALNKVISKARRERHHAGGLPDDWDTADTIPTPAEAVAEWDLAEHAWRRLSERECWLFEQNKVLRRNWADIAEEVGGDPDALRIQLARAIARLRKELQHEEAEDVR